MLNEAASACRHMSGDDDQMKGGVIERFVTRMGRKVRMYEFSAKRP